MIWIIIAVVAFVILICFLLAIANDSQNWFLERYRKMNEIQVETFQSSLEFVLVLNNRFFKNKLKILRTEKQYYDAYSRGRVILSEDTLKNNSLASYTIIAHELGHAQQDIEGNTLKSLEILRILGRIFGALLFPLLIAGVVLTLIGESLFAWGIGLLCGGILILLLSLFIKLKTISIEKDASKRAINFLKEFLDEKQLVLCRKFLNDAKRTYWADFLRVVLAWTFMTKKTKLFN